MSLISIFKYKDGYQAIGKEGLQKTFLAPTNTRAADEYITRVIKDAAIDYYTINKKEAFSCYECYRCNCWNKTLKKFKRQFVKIRYIKLSLSNSLMRTLCK